MIRTSLFSIDVEFGSINTPNGKYSLNVPDEWANGFTKALFIKDFNDGRIKIIPVACDVALLRIKTRDLATLQTALQKMMFERGLEFIFSTGVCKEISDCYTEVVVKNDKTLIENFIDLKMNKEKMLIEDALVIFLNEKYQRIKELVKKTGTDQIIKDFLSLVIGKHDTIKRLDGVKDKENAAMIQEILVLMMQNIL